MSTPFREASAGRDFVGQNLKNADFRGLDLEGVAFSRANLEGANFSGANVSRADFSHAVLVDTDFTGANLDGANLRGANVARINVEGASLHRARVDSTYAGCYRGYKGTPDFGTGEPAALSAEPLPYRTVSGHNVRCTQCAGELFVETSALLNTRGMEMLDLGWLNRGTTVLTCHACGHLEWFARGVSRR
jgi:uncharacterized protein YjbI with pentapeptide repeats